ncbi:hypothetical protein PIB30_103615, partial [Stylosanthes scabra]|nr:hypothetical protein [Stylosanthes scabra]
MAHAEACGDAMTTESIQNGILNPCGCARGRAGARPGQRPPYVESESHAAALSGRVAAWVLCFRKID